MKVAIVVNTSWNIYNFRMGLIRSLQAEGAEVYAVAPYDQYSAYLEQAGCHYFPLKMDSRGANPLRDMALIAELCHVYNQIKPDVILHYTIKPNIYGTLAATLLKIPVVNNVSGLGTVFLTNSWVSKTAMFLYRRVFRYPRKIFFQNTKDQELFHVKKLVKPHITDILPGSGLPVHQFDCQPETSNAEFTFLMVSRLIIDKGIREYIEAIRLLKKQGIKARFQLLGALDTLHKRGIQAEELENWQQEGLIDYLGVRHDVRPALLQADCIVLPSYREGTPRTLLEGAASGKPLVATDVPGCNNIVKDKVNGLLCEVRNARDLADKMDQMFQMENQKRIQMGLQGRAIIEKYFDEKLVVNKYLHAIREIVKKKKPQLRKVS